MQKPGGPGLQQRLVAREESHAGGQHDFLRRGIVGGVREGGYDSRAETCAGGQDHSGGRGAPEDRAMTHSVLLNSLGMTCHVWTGVDTVRARVS